MLVQSPNFKHRSLEHLERRSSPADQKCTKISNLTTEAIEHLLEIDSNQITDNKVIKSTV